MTRLGDKSLEAQQRKRRIKDFLKSQSSSTVIMTTYLELNKEY